MMVVEDLNKGINNSLKEIQDNTAKQVQVLKEAAHGHNNQRKCKMILTQKDPNPKHQGNPGHNEKSKPKDDRYRRE